MQASIRASWNTQGVSGSLEKKYLVRLARKSLDKARILARRLGEGGSRGGKGLGMGVCVGVCVCVLGVGGGSCLTWALQ